MSRIYFSSFLLVTFFTAGTKATSSIRKRAYDQDVMDQPKGRRPWSSSKDAETTQGIPSDVQDMLQRIMESSSLSMSLPTIEPSPTPTCSDVESVCTKLPPDSSSKEVDIFFLLDDTGSFEGFAAEVQSLFASLLDSLRTALPDVDFGFGVGRFEDYGGPGSDFSNENQSGRPFILNQPIVTSSDAGGVEALDSLVGSALRRSAPGYGGDVPESAIAEGLYQVATGLGFDGNGDGSTTGTDGGQIAGNLQTQTNPDDSGDVPAFSTLDPTVISSGSIGGAGFRKQALKLAIVATDVCSVAAFDSSTQVPDEIVGTFSTEKTMEYICPESERSGFVSDAYSAAENTISGAVAPKGAGTVPEVVSALNAAGIRVIGLEPDGVSLSFLRALARTTGAVDDNGDPLVFKISSNNEELKDAILNAITTTVAQPINVGIAVTCDEIELTASKDPYAYLDVEVGSTLCFNATVEGPSSFFPGTCNYVFFDADTELLLASGAFSVEC